MQNAGGSIWQRCEAIDSGGEERDGQSGAARLRYVHSVDWLSCDGNVLVHLHRLVGGRRRLECVAGQLVGRKST